jgi:HK97 family phage portal protein
LLWRATVADAALDGNAYWVKIQDAALRVTELWWVPSSLIEPRWPREGSEFITHYEYRPGGEPVRLETSQVVHFRWDIDPANNRKGLSPLASVLREVFADDEAGRFAASLLKNMGVPGLVIAPDGDGAISDDDLEATKVGIQEKTTGDKRGEPMIFGSATKVQQFGFNPQQMDMRTLRKVPEERVSGVLGVPAIVAGLGAGLDRSTFSNYAEAREAATENAVVPLQRLFAAEITHQLLPDFEADPKSVRFRFDLSEVRALQEDENAIVERKLKELSGGAITLGEYRRETGRESGPEHEVYLRGFSIVEVRVEDLGKEPEPAPALPAPGEQLQLLPGEPKDEPPKPKARAPRRAKTGTALQRRLNDAYMRQAELLSRNAAPRVETVLDSLGMDCAAAFVALAKQRKEASEPDLRALAAQILAAVDVKRHAGKLKAVVEQHYAQVTDNTVSTINAVLDMNVNLPDYKAREIIAQGGLRAGLIDLEASAVDSIFNALLDGRVLGEGQAELGRRIRSQVPAGPFVNAGPKYRSELIAGTETRNAQRLSAMAAYREAGATHVLAFDAQGGGDTDLHCELRNGQTFTLDEFDAEIADAHPNCTLSGAPVFA